MTDIPRVGDQFGAFRITDEIGRGGMGMVFAAVQLPLNRPVALKVLDPRLTTDVEFIGRFQREAELLARMNSPHVVQVYEHGRIGDCLYLVMQHIGGGDLARYLRRSGPLPLATALDLTGQIAAALADAHALGVIHRDIKPSNVLLARTGADLFAYLCDFGIAQSAQQGFTRAGTLAGTIEFTAPERHEGRPADARSDLYSLGCLLWCMVSGVNPYSGTDFQIAQQHFSAPVPQLASTGPVETAINRLLAAFMAKEPSQRPQSAVQAVADLRTVQRLAESMQDEPAEPLTQLAQPRTPPPREAEQDVGVTTLASRPVYPPPPPPPPPPPAPLARGRSMTRTVLITAAIVVATALVGGGGLWAFTMLSNGSASGAATGTPTAPPTNGAPPAPSVPSASAARAREPARELVDEIGVGSQPHGIAMDVESRRAFVANYGDGSVSVLNLETSSAVRKIKVGKNPQNVAVDSASGVLLVGCDGSHKVQIYDLHNYRLIGSINTGDGPIRLAIDSSNKVAYAVAQGQSTMQVISLTTHKVVRTIPVPANPRVIALDQKDQIAYVGHWASSTVSIIDLTTGYLVTDIRVGRNPNSIVIAAEARLALVASHGVTHGTRGSVSVIDLDSRSLRRTIKADPEPSRIVLDESAGVAYLTCLSAGKVNVIDLTSLEVVDRLNTSPRPTGALVDPVGGRLYVTSFDGNVVQVFSA